jgi:SAM-dependent methyltransferase
MPQRNTHALQDQEDFDYLLKNAQIGKSLGIAHFRHLDQPIGLWNYIRIANDIQRQMPTGHLLDWGCGYGQMTYLLRRRGLQVTPFDIGAPDSVMPDIPICRGLDIVRSQHPTALPFDTQSFDAVLSCGVLEHVDEGSEPGNEMKSLGEINRVLKTDGRLLIYQLPQRYAWQEAALRRLKLGYSHPRRYTASEIAEMLAQTGFRLLRLRRSNLIPKNLTGIPNRLREVYSLFSRPFIYIDQALCRVPLLNQTAGVLEVTAQRVTR